MSVPGIKRLEELEAKNAWLNKLPSDQSGENDFIKDARQKLR